MSCSPLWNSYLPGHLYRNHCKVSYYVHISLYSVLNQKKLGYIVLTCGFVGCIIQCVPTIISFILLWVAVRLPPFVHLFLNHHFREVSPTSLSAQSNLFFFASQQPSKVLGKYIFWNTIFVFIVCCGWVNILGGNRMTFQAIMFI